MINGYALWEYISDYAYVLITIVGVAIIMGIVYVQRRRADGYYNRERRK